jgi:quercetin dioxygenase-like cupin family protein
MPAGDESGAVKNSGTPVRPFAVCLEDQPLEGVGDLESGNLTWRTLISGDRTPSSEMIVGVADFPPYGRLKLHRHQQAEFYFGLSGAGIVTADGATFRIAKHIAIYIPGNTEHGISAGEAGLSILYGFAWRAFDEIVYRFSGP